MISMTGFRLRVHQEMGCFNSLNGLVVKTKNGKLHVITFFVGMKYCVFCFVSIQG